MLTDTAGLAQAREATCSHLVGDKPGKLALGAGSSSLLYKTTAFMLKALDNPNEHWWPLPSRQISHQSKN